MLAPTKPPKGQMNWRTSRLGDDQYTAIDGKRFQNSTDHAYQPSVVLANSPLSRLRRSWSSRDIVPLLGHSCRHHIFRAPPDVPTFPPHPGVALFSFLGSIPGIVADMDHEVSASDYAEIEALIASDASPVGIDAKKTHIIIINKLLQIEQRLDRLERLQRKIADKDQ